MKIRQGFVSNSSSSSFIVRFKSKPASVKELQEMMFGKDSRMEDPYYDETHSTKQIAQIVWDDMQGQKPNNYEELVEELSSLSGYSWDLYDKMRNEKGWDWQEQGEYTKIIREKEINNYLDGLDSGEIIYIFNYGDEGGGIYAAMEHGGIFNALPHTRISHH